MSANGGDGVGEPESSHVGTETGRRPQGDSIPSSAVPRALQDAQLVFPSAGEHGQALSQVLASDRQTFRRQEEQQEAPQDERVQDVRVLPLVSTVGRVREPGDARGRGLSPERTRGAVRGVSPEAVAALRTIVQQGAARAVEWRRKADVDVADDIDDPLRAGTSKVPLVERSPREPTRRRKGGGRDWRSHPRGGAPTTRSVGVRGARQW